MKIKIQENGNALKAEISGKVDTITAPELEKQMLAAISDKIEVTLDFGKVDYISSAGLRVVLLLKKNIDKQGGKLVISNVNVDVYEVFEMTGFADNFEIEKK